MLRQIKSDRLLGPEEMDSLVAESELMDVLDINKTWAGDGMLYRTTTPGIFHFVDQKYQRGD